MANIYSLVANAKCPQVNEFLVKPNCPCHKPHRFLSEVRIIINIHARLIKVIRSHSRAFVRISSNNIYSYSVEEDLEVAFECNYIYMHKFISK